MDSERGSFALYYRARLPDVVSNPEGGEALPAMRGSVTMTDRVGQSRKILPREFHSILARSRENGLDSLMGAGFDSDVDRMRSSQGRSAGRAIDRD